MKEITAILKKTKKWCDEESIEYEDKTAAKPALRLGLTISGIDVDLLLTPHYITITTRIQLNENQTQIIRQMNEKEKDALYFDLRKEIFSDPFLRSGQVSGSHSEKGVEHITLHPHTIYYESLTKEKLMHTLIMLWKSYNKYLMIVQEHTKFPY